MIYKFSYEYDGLGKPRFHDASRLKIEAKEFFS